MIKVDLNELAEYCYSMELAGYTHEEIAEQRDYLMVSEVEVLINLYELPLRIMQMSQG